MQTGSSRAVLELALVHLKEACPIQTKIGSHEKELPTNPGLNATDFQVKANSEQKSIKI